MNQIKRDYIINNNKRLELCISPSSLTQEVSDIVCVRSTL